VFGTNEHLFYVIVEEKGAEELIDLIAGMQSKRMDEQRVELPHLPGLVPPPGQSFPVTKSTEGSEDFFEMLMRCQVGNYVKIFSLVI
jgi:G-protein signaling modulator 2